MDFFSRCIRVVNGFFSNVFYIRVSFMEKLEAVAAVILRTFLLVKLEVKLIV